MVQSGRLQVIIWHMPIACLIPKVIYIYTQSEYIKNIAFPPQQWFCKHASNVAFILTMHVFLSVQVDSACNNDCV